MTHPPQQIAELPNRDGRRGAVIAGSRELEPGARAMLLAADGLFRLDVRVRGDSLQTVVRGLSPAPVVALRQASPNVHRAGELPLEAGAAGLAFAIGDESDRIEVAITLGTVRLRERGLIRVSGQAILRQPGA